MNSSERSGPTAPFHSELAGRFMGDNVVQWPESIFPVAAVSLSICLP